MRSRVEWAAQIAGVALIALALFTALRAGPPTRAPVSGDPEPEVLARWSTGNPPVAAHARISEVPVPALRDWLAALARSGTVVSWTGDSLIPIAATVRPAAVPAGGHVVRVASPHGRSVRLADAAGEIEILPVEAAGAALQVRALGGAVSASTRGRGALVAPASEGSLRGVLVLGSATWESKFVIAALEEAGWRVTARLAVAPDTWVEQGTLGVIDTSRYGAVVVIDSGAERWSAEIARYARSGGGVVLAGNAVSLASFRVIAPGRTAQYLAAGTGSPPDSAPRSALGVHPIAMLAPDAVVLERRGATVTSAARRLSLGRVMQVGYDETWRWRLAGGDDAPRRHREWWSRVVSSVAYVPHSVIRDAPAADSLDAAPLAHLIDALGPPVAERPAVAGLGTRSTMPVWPLACAVILLVLAWGSRRLRGVR